MKRKIAAPLTVTFITLLAAGPVFALEGVNGDPFEGVTVTANSSTIFNADDINDMFEGPTGSGPIEPLSLIWFDGASLSSFVNFQTSSAVAISGVNLFSEADGGIDSGDRALASFRFLADLNGDATYETELVPANNPADNGAGNFYAFLPVTAQFFRAEFINGTGGAGGFTGARVNELDAVLVPEPASLGLLGLSAAGLLARRRRPAATSR